MEINLIPKRVWGLTNPSSNLCGENPLFHPLFQVLNPKLCHFQIAYIEVMVINEIYDYDPRREMSIIYSLRDFEKKLEKKG